MAADRSAAGILRIVDGVVFSGLWVALAAVAITAACARALGVEPGPALWLLIGCGTLLVYVVDRLRDLDRDRATAPGRSGFVARHRRALVLLALAAALGAAGAAWTLPGRIVFLLAPVLGLGLAHRRLKSWRWAKPVYVSGAWALVCLGLPVWIADAPRDPGWVAVPVVAALVANAIASNLRDDESALPPPRALALARGIAVLGVVAALLAPPAARLLLPLPLAVGLSLLRFRPDERYGLLVVDGALVIGAVVSLALPSPV